MNRPKPDLVQAAYNHIFQTSLARLKDSALDGRVLPINADTSASDYLLPGRSIAWKVFLIPPPPLTSALSASPLVPTEALRQHRRDYIQILKEKLQAPDGSYEPGVTIPGETAPLSEIGRRVENWERNNPLSLDEENPWTSWFAAVDLRKTIAQDVERTFPEITYFRQKYVQDALTTILFLHSVLHPNIGYRQGMHELLAPIFQAVDYDSVDTSNTRTPPSADLSDLCDRTWIAADSWALFGLIMQHAGAWYEWREPPIRQSSHGPIETKPYVAPIVSTCNEISSKILRSIDPTLYSKMQEVEIEPQLFGIRWLRLLFSREFSMAELLPLWDAIFAIDPTLAISKWVCVAMLMRVRNQLIPTDYSGQLTILLRYPKLSHLGYSHTTLLVKQAEAMRNSPTASTGATIVVENRNVIGIPVEVPEPETTPRRPSSRGSPVSNKARRGGGSFSDFRKDPGGLQELIANRLLDVNSVVYNTVSEFRRNLPELNLNELSSSIARAASPPTETTAFPYQNVTRTSSERPSWEPNSRFELEKRVSELQSMQKQLGNAMEWALESLQISSDQEDENKQRAVACLSYIREILGKGTFQNLDKDIVMSPEELEVCKTIVDLDISGPSDHLQQGIVTDPLQSSPIVNQIRTEVSHPPPRTSSIRDSSISQSVFNPAASSLDWSGPSRQLVSSTSSFNMPRSLPGIANRQPYVARTAPTSAASSRQSLHTHSASAFVSSTVTRTPSPSRPPLSPSTSLIKPDSMQSTYPPSATKHSSFNSQSHSGQSSTIDPLGVLK